MDACDSLYGEDSARRLRSIREDGGAYPECLAVSTSGVSLTSPCHRERVLSARIVDNHSRRKGGASSNVQDSNLSREHVRRLSHRLKAPKQTAVANA